ncbi:hypothetical protein [Pseudomonas sp. NA-150]|uniref:hypothetical protein n=1 Tax=Pseudomonas sp. NA-150 TaxID=3367525 RepID=UPI0037CA92C2
MDILDIASPITYSKKLVIFFDVMGWKSHVWAAGSDPAKEGHLALLPRLLKSSNILQAAASGEARITSFSDCCVISVPFDQATLANVIYGLSSVFLGAALSGFLLRAGVTVGEIHHEQDIVFGPALNAAHDLESKGRYPRIILDKGVPDLTNLQLLEGMLGNDEHGTFVDPYALQYVKSDYLKKESLPDGTFMSIPTSKAIEIYTVLLLRLEDMLAKAENEKPKDQVNWLYTRVRRQHKSILGG